MATFSVEKEIQAPCATVFAQAMDIPNSEKFIPAITKIEPLQAGPPQVGWRWRETRFFLGKEATEEMWIIDIQKDRQYVVEAKSNGMHYTTTFRFQPRNNGQTTLMEMIFDAKPVTLFAKLLSPLMFLMRGTMVKAVEADLQAIKRTVEAA
jgi:hypothetical protein